MISPNSVLLPEIAELTPGFPFDSAHFNTEGQGLPLVRIRDVNRGYSKTFYSGDVPHGFHIQDGDFLIGMDGEFNIAVWDGGEALLNQRVCKITPRAGVIEPNYLLQVLPRILKKIEDRTPFVTVKHLSMKELKIIQFQLPALDEQKRIAAILDKADKIRRKRREALTLADDFLRAVFLEMFGDPVLNDMDWPVAALDTVADVRSGATKGRKLQDKSTTTLPYMRVANVQDGRLSLDDIQEIEVLTSEVDKYSLQAGDLLLTEGGDPDKLGRGAVWNAELQQCLHQNHIFAVRANTVRVLPEFLSAQISSLRGKRYFLKVGKQTTGIATINKTVLRQYPTLVPPLAAQQKYVEVTAKIRSYKESLQIALQASEEFFSANSAKLLSA